MLGRYFLVGDKTGPSAVAATIPDAMLVANVFGRSSGTGFGLAEDVDGTLVADVVEFELAPFTCAVPVLSGLIVERAGYDTFVITTSASASLFVGSVAVVGVGVLVGGIALLVVGCK